MVSLAAVWQAAGVTPDAVVGHSQGEIAAATVAGILSLEDAARVVAVRSRALSALDARGRDGVGGDARGRRCRELLARWGGRLSVAAVNGPAATVVSGDPQALAEFEAELSARRVLRWPVPASDFVAHSAAGGGAGRGAGAGAGRDPPGGRAGAAVLHRDRAGGWTGPGWMPGTGTTTCGRRSGSPTSVRALAADGYRTFIEVSPHPVLTAAVTETVEDADAAVVAVVTGTLDREDAGRRAAAGRPGPGPRAGHHGGLGRGAGPRAAGRPAHLRLPAAAVLARGARPRHPGGRHGPAGDRGLAVPGHLGAGQPSPVPAVLPGTWLVVVPAGTGRGDWPVVRAGAGGPRRPGGGRRGRRGEPDREALAARIGQVAVGRSLSAASLSLLALDEAPLPGSPGRAGRAGRDAGPGPGAGRRRGRARRCGC